MTQIEQQATGEDGNLSTAAASRTVTGDPSPSDAYCVPFAATIVPSIHIPPFAAQSASSAKSADSPFLIPEP